MPMPSPPVSIVALLSGQEKGGFVKGTIVDFQNVQRGQYDITEIVLSDGTATGKLAVFSCSLALTVGATLCASGVYTKEYRGEYSMAVSKQGKVWIDNNTPIQATPNPLEVAIAQASPRQAAFPLPAQAQAVRAPVQAPVQAPVPDTRLVEILQSIGLAMVDKGTYLQGVAQNSVCLTQIHEALVSIKEELVATKIALLDQLKAILLAQSEDYSMSEE